MQREACLFWTPWLLEPSLLLGAGITALSIAIMLVAFRHGIVSRKLLAAMGSLYLLFAGLLIALPLGG